MVINGDVFDGEHMFLETYIEGESEASTSHLPGSRTFKQLESQVNGMVGLVDDREIFVHAP